MLATLNRMRVSVCTVGASSRTASGMLTFLKNNCSFPQELNEVKHMPACMSKWQPDDIVNVRLALRAGDPVTVHRALIAKIRETSFGVLLANGPLHEAK